ncbi:MAG TPA: hypothetical protein VLT35_07105 [Methanocella sp.]|nr:hypothetical protein [Methanocella sp.]
MNLDDNLLIGLTESLFSRLRKEEEPGETAEEDAGSMVPAEDADTGLTLPGEEPIGGKARRKGVARARVKAEAVKPPRSISLGKLFSGMLHHGKEKDKIAQEVQVIDQELKNVLEDVEVIKAIGMPQSLPDASTPHPGSNRAPGLDLDLGGLSPRGDFIKPDELQLEPPMPAAAPPKPETPRPAPGTVGAGKTADEALKPPEPEAKMPDVLAGGKKDVGDDLLSDLEQAAHQAEDLDLSIMKEYQDMTITGADLESELKGILDQITINSQNKMRAR